MVVRVIDPDDASPSGFLLHLMLPDAREPALAHSIVENVLEYFRLKLGLTAVGLQRRLLLLLRVGTDSHAFWLTNWPTTWWLLPTNTPVVLLPRFTYLLIFVLSVLGSLSAFPILCMNGDIEYHNDKLKISTG